MPVDVNEESIRLRQIDPDLFEKKSFRTIPIGSEDSGIQAVIGKKPGSDTTEIQTYIFNRKKWDLERAKAWVAKEKEGVSKAVSLFPRNIATAIEKGSTALAQAFKKNADYQRLVKNSLGLVTVAQKEEK